MKHWILTVAYVLETNWVTVMSLSVLGINRFKSGHEIFGARPGFCICSFRDYYAVLKRLFHLLIFFYGDCAHSPVL